MIVAVGCSESFDDSLIWEEINSLKDRVTTLEQLCKQMNTNISSLQTIVTALQNNDYVTNISPITEDGKTIGYTITFSKSGSVTIYHGKDGAGGKNGADGYTPVIGVAKDTDGLYYWTLDGEWLLDNDGNKVKAQGVDGKDGVDGADGKDGVDGTDGKDGVNGTDGKDGVTPKLKIENGYWYISYDNGSSWTQLDKATGENGQDGKDGDSMFKEVTYDDDYVYITLSDGSILKISCTQLCPSNQIWYTNGSSTTATTPSVIDAFGVNIVSNLYDVEKKHWIITFDGNVTSIGKQAFYGYQTNCNNLTSITIPDGVTKIDYAAFYGCGNLVCVTIPNSVTTIDYAAFMGCSSLTNVTIPNSVTEIGNDVFSDCRSLTSFYGKYASADNRCLIIDGKLQGFAGAGLTTYTIPDGVSSIGWHALYGCSLTCITIPNSVSSIDVLAFYGCRSLSSFYGKYASADNRCLIIDGRLQGFAGAGLTTYTIPDGVSSIGDYTFFGCALTGITIPESVSSIGESSFDSCQSLTSITIPEGVTSIGSGAFWDCCSLSKVYCKPKTPPIVGLEHVFAGNAYNRKIYVPTESLDAYKSADGWKDYADYIVGYDF